MNHYVNPRTQEDAAGNFKAIGQSENGLEKQENYWQTYSTITDSTSALAELDDQNLKDSLKNKAISREFYDERTILTFSR